jgi:hypothetical protein
MPTVRVYGDAEGRPEGEVFISLEQAPIVLANIRAALPHLRANLRKRWPVERVEIDIRLPRLQNSSDTWSFLSHSHVIADVGVGILVLYLAEAVRAAGKKTGEAAGKEIAGYVRRWLHRVSHTQSASAGTPTVTRSYRTCECGCGGRPKSPKSRFLPGHDLRKAYNEAGGSSKRTAKGDRPRRSR